MKDLTIRAGRVFSFGDKEDGVVGVAGLTHDGHPIETSYFFGTNKPKSIIVVSSQAGCPMSCSFCELGQEKFVRSLTAQEIHDQAVLLLAEVRKRGVDITTTPHKITVANTGEPMLNPHLVSGLESMKQLCVSFKVSTVFPNTKVADRMVANLADFAAQSGRIVQLQISLISTSEEYRKKTSGAKVVGFQKIRQAGEMWHAKNPTGRKVNLSLIITGETPCDAGEIAHIFSPELFRFRFREYVPTENGDQHGLNKVLPTRLAEIKKGFEDRGYEVFDWASPTPIEWKFGLAGNVIRKMYLDTVK